MICGVHGRYNYESAKSCIRGGCSRHRDCCLLPPSWKVAWAITATMARHWMRTSKMYILRLMIMLFDSAASSVLTFSFHADSEGRHVVCWPSVHFPSRDQRLFVARLQSSSARCRFSSCTLWEVSIEEDWHENIFAAKGE